MCDSLRESDRASATVVPDHPWVYAAMSLQQDVEAHWRSYILLEWMAMYRPPKLIAVACIAVVFLTAAIPALWDDLSVVMEPLDPVFGVVFSSVSVEPPDVHPSPFPFLTLADSRGPPAL